MNIREAVRKMAMSISSTFDVDAPPDVIYRFNLNHRLGVLEKESIELCYVVSAKNYNFFNFCYETCGSDDEDATQLRKIIFRLLVDVKASSFVAFFIFFNIF